jgi:hypothetical protein
MTERRTATRSLGNTFFLESLTHTNTILTIDATKQSVYVLNCHHCVVQVGIGKKTFRCALDTGAARSLIRTSFADKLRQSVHTKSALVSRIRAKNGILCEGVVSGMTTEPISVFDTFRLAFQSTDPAERTKGRSGQGSVDIAFGELSSAADALLIGFPDLLSLCPTFRTDSDGAYRLGWRVLGCWGVGAEVAGAGSVG